MKTIVIYSSKTGFSEKYGKWIAEELSCKAVSLKEMPKNLNEFECIIFGGGIMAGKISGLDKFKKNPSIAGKKIVVFATGATPSDATEIVQTFKDNNLTSDEQKEIPFFYFHSGLNFEKMGFMSKALLNMMKNMLEKKADKTPEDEGMLETFRESKDFSNQKFIEPLVTLIKELQ